ncbi:MAG: NAD-dependent epimerase/dehydratase family protein [Rhizomicrobium sp.]
MAVLVTGAAGFIGYHVSAALLARGENVIGIDNLNDYYDVNLKLARLKPLKDNPAFQFHDIDLADRAAMVRLARAHPDITRIVHLGAQAGVRFSLIDPYAYVSSNLMGHVTVLELARNLKHLEHMVYASSSSVYGGNEKVPFSVADAVETPQSLYAATKRADELMSYTYAHLYGLKLTGLRFFTVYGPWGRPDMAPMLFTKAILSGQPIRVFNNGEMWRDFTYIDDIVAGILAILAKAPEQATSNVPPHKVYNIGNSRSEKLTDFIATLETALGRKAERKFEPMQPGDVVRTYADISDTTRDFGYEPTTPISVGIPKFVAWYRSFYDM